MASEWLYNRAGVQHGPISSAQLKELAASGGLAPSDLVWKEGMPEWFAAGRLKGLFPQPSAAVSAPPPIVPPPLPPGSFSPPPRIAEGSKMKTSVLVLTIIGAAFSLIVGIGSGACIQSVGELNRSVGNMREANEAQSFSGMLVLAGLAQFAVGGFGGLKAYRFFGTRQSLKWGVLPLVVAGLLSITNTCSFCTSGILFFTAALLAFLGTRSPTVQPMSTDDGSPSVRNEQAETLGSRLKAAGHLAAGQAQRAKLLTVTLPAAHKALGKHLYLAKLYREEFPELYQEFDRLSAEIKAITSQASARPTAEGVAAKTKAAAAGVKDMAQTKSLEVRLAQALGKFGAAVYDKHGEQSGPSNIVQPISDARSQIAAIDEQIAMLSKSKPGQFFTPKRIAIAGVCVVALVGLAIVGNMAGHGNSSANGSSPQSTNAEANNVGKTTVVTSESTATDQQNRVDVSGLTKKQFIEKLRQTMAPGGRIDDTITNAWFRNYAFQNAFGDPDSKVEWTNGQRLYTYRCSNGSIQLTVTVADGFVSLDGLNEY